MPNMKGGKPPAPAGYLWIEDAAPYIGQARTTLYKWRQLDKGPRGVPIGRYLAYRIADLDAHLDGLYEAATRAEPSHESRPPEPRIAHHSRRHTARAAA
ncbi:helix-turn-helix transcriptional regulator [Streptomyces himalayensis]|uniref:Helix-turn-helix domain-containing protein n=1 Tax=Streptomyces himalayensis subsp. himalayensis TaxID=2756131 RepID=A0A7W0IDV7_9ACTN|nr:hypothetical protein [Streptomyces himalayensis]MBA2951649.1 hypothetical protein [Streptomyces himalayensis subsp. himalayensis]